MYKIYIKPNGHIYHTRQCKVEPDPGEGIIVDRMVDLKTEYYNDDSVVPRPEMDLIINNLSISNIPTGTEVRIDDDTKTINDGVLDLEFDLPGEYTLYFTNFPYQNKEVLIEV